MRELKPNPLEIFAPINAYYDVAIPASQKANHASSLHATQYLEQYLNGIILQWNRIVIETNQATTAMITGNRAVIRLHKQEELDFHFYLICWDKVRKYFSMVEKFERDKAISDCWKNVSELLTNASRGRDFYEHLDEQLSKGGVGTRGRGFGYPEGYHFSYVRIEKGDRVERKVNLGMDEIRRVREAYEEVIATLRARVKPTEQSETHDTGQQPST